MLIQDQPAPDLTVESIGGEHIDLSRLRGKKVLIKFHRFAGCPVARRQIDAFMAQHGELARAGVESIIFLHSSRKNLIATFREAPGVHIVSDEAKIFYRRFHSAFRFQALFAPRSWLATLASFLKGYFPIFTRFEGGILAVPSDILVDENGAIAKVHYGRDFGDTWSADEVVEYARAGRRHQPRTSEPAARKSPTAPA
jgi:peroxiredoxin Q/BCP